MPGCISAQFDRDVFCCNESPNKIEHSIFTSKCKQLNDQSSKLKNIKLEQQ